MRKTAFRMAAGLLALMLGAAACGGSSGGSGSKSGNNNNNAGGNVPGVTATTITIGSHQPLTGPAAPGYSEIAPSAKAMFDYINKNGGINGRKIIYKYLDDGYNPTNTVSVVRELVLQDNVFAIFNGLGTPTHEKVVDFLNQQKVPDLFVASGCKCWNEPKQHPYTFGFQPEYTVEGAVMGKYIADNLKGKKIAYFYQNDDFGKDGVEGLDKYIPASQVVARTTYTTSNTDLTSQVSQMKSKGADVVVSFSIPAFTALLKLNMLKAGWNPEIYVSNVGSDPVTLSGLLEAFAKKGGATVQGNQLIQGLHTNAYLPPYGASTNDKWVALFKKVHDQAGLPFAFDGNVEYGMSVAWSFAEVVKKAGKNFTRDSFVKAAEETNFQGPGLVQLKFSPDNHAGFQGTQMGTIQGDTIVLQGQPEDVDSSLGVSTSSYKEASPADSGLLPSSAL